MGSPHSRDTVRARKSFVKRAEVAWEAGGLTHAEKTEDGALRFGVSEGTIAKWLNGMTSGPQSFEVLEPVLQDLESEHRQSTNGRVPRPTATDALVDELIATRLKHGSTEQILGLAALLGARASELLARS